MPVKFLLPCHYQAATKTKKQEKPRVFSHCSLKFSNYTNISAFHIVLETLLLIDRVMILSIDDADFLALSAV